MSNDFDAGSIRSRLVFSVHGEDEAARFEARTERLQRQKDIERKLNISTDEARRELEKLEKVERDLAKEHERREAVYAALPEKTRQQRNRIFNRMLRDERAHARETEQIRKNAAKAVDDLNKEMSRRAGEQVRERGRQLAEMRRLEDAAYREDARRSKQHAREMARTEEAAYREDARRRKQHLAEMGRLEQQAYAENARREDQMRRESARNDERHMRAREKRLMAIGASISGALPGLNFSTRIPVYQIAALALGAQAAIPPIVALTGSLGPLAGWLGAIPGLAATAGAGILTAFLGLKGVGGALGAAWEAQASASEDGVDAAKRQESAARQVEAAQRTLEDAERSRTDAVEALEDAQDDVNQATKDATRELRDMRIEADAANATEGDRVERLRQAREELGRLRVEGAGQREIAAAQREVTFAEVELARTRAQGRDDAEALRNAERDGVKRMPQVVAARERVTEAERSLADARRGVEDAQRGVSQANREATRDMAEMSGGTKKLDEAMRELGPSGQAFVTLVATKFFPIVKQLRSTAQEGLLPGLGEGMDEASKNAPILERVVGRISKTLGDNALDWGKFLGSKSFGRDFEQIMGQSDELLDRGGKSSINFASGLRHIAVAAEPLTDWLGKMAVKLSENFEGWAKNGRESGKLRGFFRETIQATKDVVGGLWDFGQGLWNIGRIGARVWGNDMRGGIRDAAKDFRDWTESVKGDRSIESYFRRWRRRWTDIKDHIGDVIGRYKDLKREGKSSTQALTTILVESLSDAFVTLAEKIGRLAPKIAAGFVKGFLEADGWGKLAIGTWLIGRLGGRGAFLAIGKTAGRWIAGSMAAQWIRYGVAGRFVDWLAGPDRMGKFRGAGDKVGRTTGRAVGRGLIIGIAAGIALFADDILRAVDEHITDPLRKKLEDLPGPLGDISKALGGLGDMMGPAWRDPAFDSSEVPEPKTDRARRRWERYRKDVEAEMEGLEGSVARSSKRTGDALDREASDGHRAAKRNFKSTAREIERQVKSGEMSTRQGYRSINRLVARHSKGANEDATREFRRMGTNVTSRMRKTRKDAGEQAKGLGSAVSGALADMGEFVAGMLKDLGLKPIKWTAKLVKKGANAVGNALEAVGDALPGGDQRASGGIVGLAGGGLVGRWGERGRDKVHAILGRGEAVLNHHQQRVVNAALRMTGMAKRGLPELFGRTKNTRHYMATGGIAGHDGASIADYYPQAFASGGMAGFDVGGAKPGFVPFMNYLNKLFGPIYVMSGLRPGSTILGSGRLSNHATGNAVDISTTENGLNFAHDAASLNATGPAAARMDALHGHMARHIKLPGDFLWRTDTGGNHWNHIHRGITSGHADDPRLMMEYISKLPKGSAFGLGNIPKVLLGGPDGPLKDIGQALLNRARKGLTRVMGDRMMTPTFGAADDIDLEGFKGSDAQLMREISEQRGWHFPDWWELDRRETNHGADIFNESSGAWGRGQFMPGITQGSYGPGSDPAQNPSMREQIISMADYISERYGNPTAAREHHDRMNWYESGGIADGVPFAGSFAGGGFTEWPSDPQGYLDSPGGATKGEIDAFTSKGGLSALGKGFRSDSNRVIKQLTDRIDNNETAYTNWSARWELDDSELINEGSGPDATPSLNMAAIENRAKDLDRLVAFRQKIYDDYRRLVHYMERLRRVLAAAQRKLQGSIGRVRNALRKLGKGKKANKRRKDLQARLDTYQGALTGITTQLGELDADLPEARSNRFQALTDLQADIQERDTLLPGAESQLAGMLDKEPAGESPDDAARRAHEMFAEFTENRRSLFADFGSNFAPIGARSAAAAAGAAVSDVTEQAAGMRYFGAASGGPMAGGGFTGGGDGGGGGTTINQTINFAGGASDERTFAHVAAHEMTAAVG